MVISTYDQQYFKILLNGIGIAYLYAKVLGHYYKGYKGHY